MKIGIFLDEIQASDGGGFTFKKNLLEELSLFNTSHEIYIFYRDYPNLKLQKNSQIKLTPILNKPKQRWFPFFKSKIKQQSDEALRQIVLHHGIELMWFITPMYIELGIPFIITLWDLGHRIHPYFPELNSIGWKWEQREAHYSNVLPKATCVVTGTETCKRDAIRFYCLDESKVQVIPFPTPSFVKQTSPIESSSILQSIRHPYVFYPAQFWAHKNHICVLLAVKQLKEKYNLDLSIVFTGSDKGNLDYIKNKANELGILQTTHFLGFVTEDDLKVLYKNALALTFMSFLGPDNLPPLEAFALECPVIASDIPGVREQLEDYAILVDPCNEEELAQQIYRLYASPDLRNRMIEKASNIQNSWSTKDYIMHILSLIEKFTPYRRTWKV
ncbi:MAG: glycosyltransferase [Chlamydiales bacterium]|jgi:glycosyltransferase involved in cell wall biosynthesis|nr:glycosyltransferase [Chlamydiales bacterium]